ncbi:MAG: hypothetical protein LIP03_08490 [Bacteroidales bacterium]|nr:hypothetical protein [Bacteroidales bacterium]
MFQNTFEYKPYERDGKTFHLLTALEHPWLNVQIIPFPESEHDEAIAKIQEQPTIGWVIEHPTRRDFAVIHAGGSGKLHFTQANVEELLADMKQCLHNAALWWADHNPQ